MQALLSPSYSEADLLHCLENSATVLDSISSVTSEPGDFDQLTGEAQREIIDNLGIVSNILQFLGERILPALFAAGAAPSTLSQLAAAKWLAHIRMRATDIELRLNEAATAIN